MIGIMKAKDIYDSFVFGVFATVLAVLLGRFAGFSATATAGSLLIILVILDIAHAVKELSM